jgi:hypothetical protein
MRPARKLLVTVAATLKTTGDLGMLTATAPMTLCRG